MNELSKQSAVALSWLKQYGITESNALPYIALAAGIVALLIALSNRRKLKACGGLQFKGTRQKVEKLELKVSDLESAINSELHKVKEQALRLNQAARVAGILPAAESEVEDFLSGPSSSSAGSAREVQRQESVTKKKSPESPAESSIHSGLAKTRTHFFSRLTDIIRGRQGIDQDAYDALEELLITSDLGVKTAATLLQRLKDEFSEDSSNELDQAQLTAVLKGHVQQLLKSSAAPEIVPRKQAGLPMIVLVVGVNGVGKTTTIGKLAAQFRVQGAKVLLGACDTFRAAASEQLTEWSRRAGVDILVGEQGAKPATVAYQAVHKAQEQGYDVLIVDTAGRLHTRVNLMNELVNVVKIIEREQPGSPHETILVLDASTGQNALQQAREFHSKAKLTGIVITKLDGTPKGGIVVAIKDELGLPIRYIGVGEGIFDLKPFDAEEFVEGLFASDSA